MLGDEEPLDPCLRTLPCQLAGGDFGLRHPAVGDNSTILDVDGDDQPLVEQGGQLGEAEACPSEGGGPDDRSGRACVDRRLNGFDVTQPAAGLHRHTGGRHPLDQSRRRAAGERAVEVDQVEPLGALLGEALGRLRWISALDRHPFPPPFEQADTAVLEDVDCGDHLEACHSSVVAC